MQGYLASDASSSGPRPGLLLLHYRNGMDAMTKANAGGIAALGYTVFAADIFGKSIRPATDAQAIEQSVRFNKDRMLTRARATAGLDVLRKHARTDGSKIASIGHCFGGMVAMELGFTGAPLKGTIIMHGSFKDFAPGAAQNIQGRLYIVHGAEDPIAPLSEVNTLIDELRKTKLDWQYELFGGADHGFTITGAPINAIAKARSMQSMQRFFAEVLA